MNKQDAQKIDEALALLNEAAKGQKDEISTLISEKYANLKNTLSGAESKLEDQAQEGVERLKELKEAAANQAKSTAGHIDRRAHEDPWKTLGWTVLGALAVGVLIGRRD
jgi:ElaB/YqjD/DUF883 family membrane-anchored ribosome-binding protein